MCLIVDTNVASEVLLEPPHADFVPLRSCLVNQKPYPATLVCGGELRREYEKNRDVMIFVLNLGSAGRMRLVPDGLCDARAAELRQSAACASDDEHIIALAQISGARLLCTKDLALQHDFRNPTLLNSPRGSVYLRPEHTSLIRRHCRQGRSRIR